MSTVRPVYGCHDKPRPTSETSYVAQASIEIIRDGFGAPFRQPAYVDIKHTMSTNCRYDKWQTDDRCRGCKNAGEVMKEAESNMPPLPDPVGMHAPAGPNGDKYPVWHHGQALDAIRAAVLKERQEIAEICDRVKEHRFASGNAREGSTARTLAEIIRNLT